MRFQFPVPAQWKVNNTTSNVQMVSKEGDAAILFSIAAGKSPAETAKAFASKNRASVLQSGTVNVHGLSSYRLVSDIPTQKGNYRVLSYFIQREQQIYVSHGLTTPALFARYDETFENTMQEAGATAIQSQAMYVLYPGDREYCVPTCPSLDTRQPAPLMRFGSRQHAEAAGYAPCTTCRPDLHPISR